MDFAEAVEHLYSLGPELPSSPARPRRFDLANMRTLCMALGNPERQFPSVLIAGTNGKGSTAAALASMVSAGGYRTGLYTSPHLSRITERIRYSSGHAAFAEIQDDDFARLYTRVQDAGNQLIHRGQLPGPPSFFERLTAIAFLAFAGEASSPPVELAVLEVGLGGRLDATNVVEPVISVITDIALDHQEYLGDTIAQIAKEKCGILRRHGIFVTLPQHPQANQAIGEAATALACRAIDATRYLPPATRNGPERKSSDLAANRYVLKMDDNNAVSQPAVLSVDFPLPGSHQQRNLALAIATAVELRQPHANPRFALSNTALELGCRSVSWPGRLEFFNPSLLLDVAHNPAGAWTLRAALSNLQEFRPRTLLFSCLRDKNLTEISRILFPLFDSTPGGDPARARDHIVLAPIDSPRAAPMQDLLEAAQAIGVPAHAAPHIAAAYAQARQITPPDGLIVATGSVFLVGAVRDFALEEAERSSAEATG